MGQDIENIIPIQDPETPENTVVPVVEQTPDTDTNPQPVPVVNSDRCGFIFDENKVQCANKIQFHVENGDQYFMTCSEHLAQALGDGLNLVAKDAWLKANQNQKGE